MSIVLCAVGDIMVGRSFNGLFKRKRTFNVWGNTKNVFNTAHLVLGNLETTISDLPDSYKIPNKTGGFYYNLKPEYAGILREIPFDYLSLANNHSFDFQLQGLMETKKSLKKLDIHYSGAGKNKAVARRPAVFKMKFIPNVNTKFTKIAVFSASDHYVDWKATQNTYGVYYINHQEPEHALDYFQYYRSTHPDTFMILSYHWGLNYEPKLPKWKRQLARKLFDSGIDLILGHSPHHIEEYERINGKYVFYSLGDFIDDYQIDPTYRNDIGMIARITINMMSGKVTNVKSYKTLINNLQVNLV